MKELTEITHRGKLMVQQIKEKLNGTAKILGIIAICISLAASMFTSVKTYVKLDFISELNNQAIVKQEAKFEIACSRIEKVERDLSIEETRSKMKDHELENSIREMKDDLKEIKILLRQMAR